MLGKRDSECQPDNPVPKKDRKASNERRSIDDDDFVNVVDVSDCEDNDRLCIDESPNECNNDQALDLSLKPKRKLSTHSLPPSFVEKPSADPNVLRPTVIHSKNVVPFTSSDYDVEEHFRKSLSSKLSNGTSESTSPESKLSPNESQRSTLIYTTEAEVEDHFARALGMDKWRKLKETTSQSDSSHVTSVNVT